MHDQPRYEPLERSGFFKDQRAARPLPAGTVARGQLRADQHFYEGRVGGRPATELPVPATAALLARGQERYGIYCTPCHDRTGSGRGMIVQRGYPAPSSFHVERLREATPGYFFDAITRGFGVMPSYAVQIPPQDRWAIIAYIRALQLSQHASVDDVPAVERGALDAPVSSTGAERPGRGGH